VPWIQFAIRRFCKESISALDSFAYVLLLDGWFEFKPNLQKMLMLQELLQELLLLILLQQLCFKLCSGYVQAIFRLCSGYVQAMFRLCSGYV